MTLFISRDPYGNEWKGREREKGTGREGEGGRIRVGKAQVGKEWERTGRNLGPECDRRIEMPRFVERVSSYNSVISTHAFCVLILKACRPSLRLGF